MAIFNHHLLYAPILNLCAGAIGGTRMQSTVVSAFPNAKSSPRFRSSCRRNVVYMLPAGLFAHRQTSLTLAGNRHWCTGNRPGVACDAARLELMKLPRHRRRMAGGLLQPGGG